MRAAGMAAILAVALAFLGGAPGVAAAPNWTTAQAPAGIDAPDAQWIEVTAPNGAGLPPAHN